MAITPTDFEKIWSTNASTPAYTFSDADYLEGWDFVGNLPPTRAQWNAIQKRTDEKMKYVFDNFGSPLVAPTVADMTLENRVYVYTGNEVGYTAGDWYYYDTGTSAWVDGGVYNALAVQTDTTLTQAGEPADAKATGDRLNIISDEVLTYTEMQVSTTATGWRLVPATGLCTSNASYKLVKYAVTEGKPYKIVSDDYFQFQTVASVPSTGASNRIGDTYATGTFYVIAPVGATYLIVSTPTTDSIAKAYEVAMAVDPTLTISGEAADAKVTGEIRSNVGITPITLTLTHGYFVYKDGTFAGGGTQNFDYSAPVPVTKGQRVELVGAGYSTNVAMISTCDSDGTNIVPKVISIDANVHTYEYVVEEDGFVMFSFHSTEGYIATIFDVYSNSVLDSRMSVVEYAIDNDLSKSIIDVESFEQGSWNNGSKVNNNYAIRFKDGYHVTNPSKVTVVPNGQYTYVAAWYTRTESGGVISFSDRAIPLDTWTDQPKEVYLPANCYLLVLVRKTYPTNTNTKPADNLVQVYVADNQIFKNRADIVDLNDRVTVLEGEVPSYWETEIARVKTAINNNRLTIGNRIAEFFFITDVHWRLNAQKSITLMNSLKKYSGIKTLLVGGDIVCTHTESQITAIEEIREFYQHLNDYRAISTIGNHDFNSNNNSSHPEAYLTANQLYSAFMSNEELFTNTNASPYVTIYDNESQKVRFIQFYHPDIISIPASVQTEVINAVQEKGTDWTVFMMCHVYWASGSVDQYITAFTEQLAGLNASGNYAKIGALIVGHMHDDKDTVVDGNLLVIGSNCDIYSQTVGQATMTAGTDTEQSFDVFQVDLANNTIYITRVGAGNDRQFTY